jgi:hypothetical protein
VAGSSPMPKHTLWSAANVLCKCIQWQNRLPKQHAQHAGQMSHNACCNVCHTSQTHNALTCTALWSVARSPILSILAWRRSTAAWGGRGEMGQDNCHSII